MFASLPLRLGGLIQTTVTTPTAPAKRPRAFRTPGFRLHLSSWEAQIHTDLVISSPRSLSWLGRSGEPAWSRLGARARHCRQPIGPRPVFFLCLRCGIVHAWQSLSAAQLVLRVSPQQESGWLSRSRRAKPNLRNVELGRIAGTRGHEPVHVHLQKLTIPMPRYATSLRAPALMKLAPEPGVHAPWHPHHRLVEIRIRQQHQ